MSEVVARSSRRTEHRRIAPGYLFLDDSDHVERSRFPEDLVGMAAGRQRSAVGGEGDRLPGDRPASDVKAKGNPYNTDARHHPILCGINGPA